MLRPASTAKVSCLSMAPRAKMNELLTKMSRRLAPRMRSEGMLWSKGTRVMWMICGARMTQPTATGMPSAASSR